MALARASAQAQRLGAGGMIGMRIEHDIDTRETGGENNKRIDLIVTFHILGTAIADAAEHRSPQPPDDRPARSRPPMSSYDPTSLEGVPEAGRGRFEQNKRGLFTSDLSVAEFLLIKEAGFDPLGLVVGSSIYHIGFQQSRWSKSEEMQVLSEAMYTARELAMTRMEEEADQLGADGIVGVRLDIGRYDWGQDMAEFIAIGTAIKHRGGELHRAPNGRPFTSRPVGPGLLDAAAHGPPPGRHGHGLVRLPRGAPRDVPVDAPGRPERRAAELHPGALRRPRAGHGAHAGRGRGGQGRGHRRRRSCPSAATAGAAT